MCVCVCVCDMLLCVQCAPPSVVNWRASVGTCNYHSYLYTLTSCSVCCAYLQCDCQRAQKQITTEEAFRFAKDQGFVKCFETSVKDGTNLNEALE